MNIIKKPIFHVIFLIAAFMIGLAFRLVRLGAVPLTNVEADLALQALSVGQTSDTIFGAHTAYIGLTGLDFLIFNAGNFLARLWPALFGGLIVFIPFLFRDQIGHWPASILSLILAITPEMVGLSRIIGSPMIAYVNLLLAFGLFLKKKPVLSGMTLAFALMGGTGFWTGILLAGLSIPISKIFFGDKIWPKIKGMFSEKHFRIRFFAAWILTIAVVGTGFFITPEIISGTFSGLIDFIRGFGVPYTQPFFLRPLALLAYSSPAVIFGIWGGIRGFIYRSKLDLFLFSLGLLGLLYLIVYPGASPADIIWVTVPLWTLTARVVFEVWRLPEDNRFVMAGTAIVVIIVFAFLLLSLRSLINPGLVQDAQLVTLIALFGGLILLIALILLVTFGWTEEIALSGLLIGLSLVVIFGMVSISTKTTGLSTARTFELWYQDQPNLSTRWLKISLGRVLEWNKRRAEPLNIAVVDYNEPGMRWLMQDYDAVDFVTYSPPATQPGIIISDLMTQPEISSSYRGQDLVWSERALWGEMSAFQYLKWLITRDAPLTTRELIFWVRTDLMPDEQFSQ